MDELTQEVARELPVRLNTDAVIKSAREISKSITDATGATSDDVTRESADRLKALWVGVTATGAPVNLDRGISDKLTDCWRGSVEATLTGDTLTQVITATQECSDFYGIPVAQAIAVISVGLANSFTGFMVEDAIVANTRLTHASRDDDVKGGIDLIDPQTGAKIQVKPASDRKKATHSTYSNGFDYLVCYDKENGYKLGLEKATDDWDGKRAYSQANGTWESEMEKME